MTDIAEAIATASSMLPGWAGLPAHELQRRGLILEVGDMTATVDRGFLTTLLLPTLQRIRFDEDFYRATHPDLAAAEAEGMLTDLHQHYLHFGFFENRLPARVRVDGSFYAREYPDVAVAILENRVRSAQDHFERIGFVEGRLPRAGWKFSELLQTC